MCETESGLGECKEHGWESKMGCRLGVWKDVILVWNGKSVELGEHDGIFLVRWMGMSLGRPMADFWEILEWTLAGRCRSLFGWKSQMDSKWEIWMEVWSDFLAGPQLGYPAGILVGNCEKASRWPSEGVLVDKWGGEVIGEAVKRMEGSWVKLWNGCEVGSGDGSLIIGAETKAGCSCRLRPLG